MLTVNTAGVPRTALRCGYTAAENDLRQSFQTSEPVAALEIGLARRGTPGTLLVSIGALTIPVPTPNVQSTDLRTPTWVQITLPQALEPNAYTVKIQTEAVSSGNYYLWTVDSGNPYPGGHLFKGERPYTGYDAFLRVHNTPLGAPPEPPVDPGEPPGPGGPAEPPAPAPGTVAKITALAGIGHAYDVCVLGRWAYVATDSGLVVVDVAKPWAPVVVGTLVIRAGTAGCYAVVTLPGERVALLGNGTSTLYLVDVSTPTAPTLEGALGLGSNCWALAAHGSGTVVYAGNWSGILWVVDVAGPTPVLRKQLGLREWRPGAEDEQRLQELEQEQKQAGAKITGLTVHGNTLAVTGWGYGRAYFFDVTDALNPDFKSTHFAAYMYKTVMYGDGRASASAGYSRFSGVESFPIPARSSQYAYDVVSPGDCADCDFVPSAPNNWDIGSGICVAPGGRHLVATGGRSDGVLMILKTQLESNPTLVTTIAPGPLGSHRLAAPLGITTVGEEYILAARGSAGLVVLRFPGLATGVPPIEPPIEPPVEPEEPPVVEFPPTDNPYGIVGYASAVVGGYGKPTVVVTQPGDTGTGSLREAVSLGGRTVVFDLPPDQRVITLESPLPIRAETTVDGYPGIWLRRRPNLAGLHEGFGGLLIRGPHHEGAHDVVIRHIGIRGSAYDGFQIWEAHNVAIDHCSAYEWIDGGCDITGPGCHHVTVSNSIFAGSDLARSVPENGGIGHDFPSLIKYGTWEVTLYRNLYTDGTQRNPQFRLGVSPPIPQGRAHLQMTNCLVHYRGHGLYAIQDGTSTPPECSKINLIKNFYSLVPGTAAKATHWALIDLKTQVYLEGNVSPKNTPPLRAPTYAQRHPAPPLDELDALAAAHAVLTSSGPAYRDATDTRLIATAGQTVPGWGA